MAAALRMPSHYVPVEAEEMEYVEGGGIYTYTLSPQTCGDIAALLGAGNVPAQLLHLIPGIGNIIAIAATSIFSLGSAGYWIASNHNGVEFTFVTLGPILIYHSCEIIW